jgi:aminoglycoside phosphotransferase (APT) family kinase protein
VPLPDRTERLEAGLEDLGDAVDRAAVRQLWSALVVAPAWSGPPLWLHGDAHPLNLLVHDGRLSAFIDFGDLTAGDPASDLSVAWMMFPERERTTFRRAAGSVDDATWARARGWAVALGVALANGDDRVAAIGRRTLAAALAAG